MLPLGFPPYFSFLCYLCSYAHPILSFVFTFLCMHLIIRAIMLLQYIYKYHST